MPIISVRNFESASVCAIVGMCPLVSNPLSSGAAARSLLPWFWSNRTECVQGRREAMEESRKEEEAEEVGVRSEGGCLSQRIGSGWFTSYGH